MDINSPKARTFLELLSVTAVVSSLIFVGLEVSESTRATRSATAAATTETISEWYMSLSNDQQVSSTLRRFLVDPGSLSIEEQYQATMNLHALMLILQNSFYLEEEGTLSPQIRRSMTQAVTSAPGVKYYWEQRKPIFVNENFITFIEQTLASDYTHSHDFYRPDE